MARRRTPSKKPPFQTELTRQSVRATIARKRLEAGEELLPVKETEASQDVLLREDLFLKCYFENGFNGAAAVRDCGAYRCKNDKVAGVTAAEILNRSRVQKRVQAFRAKYGYRFGVTNEKIEQRLSELAFSNMSDYLRVQEDGSVVTDLSVLSDPEVGRAHGAAIREIETETYVDGYEGTGDDRIPIQVKRTKLKLYDSKSAIEALARIRQLPGYTNVPAAQFNAQNLQIIYNSIEQKLLQE